MCVCCSRRYFCLVGSQHIAKHHFKLFEKHMGKKGSPWSARDFAPLPSRRRRRWGGGTPPPGVSKRPEEGSRVEGKRERRSMGLDARTRWIGGFEKLIHRSKHNALKQCGLMIRPRIGAVTVRLEAKLQTPQLGAGSEQISRTL